MRSTTPQTRIAKRLQEDRRTQVWLARKLGVTRQTLRIWIRGEEKCPAPRQAQIALFLGVMPAYPLFDRDGYALREDT